MQWHDFVFSKQSRLRFLRHVVFWGTWWLYFSAIYWYNQHIPGMGYNNFIKLGSYILLKSFLLLFIHALGCYVFIYFLFPRYLVKSKWLKLIAGVFMLSILIFVTGYLMYRWAFPFVDSIFNDRAVAGDPSLLWNSISIGLLNASKVIAAAATIKLMKYWWLKQKEKERLEKERITTELQLLKAQIRPGFLFKALNNIYAYSLAGSPRASEMLLKLSDLLSYMLYECDQPLVLLEKEIEMMREYMTLEKIRMADNLEMQIEVKGRTQDRFIAPFLLLPFIENSFKQCNAMTEKCWISLEIKVEENAYLIKIINGISPEINSQAGSYGNGLVSVQKRLNLLYPNQHELKMTAEEEVFLVNLKIQFEGSPSTPASGENESKGIENAKEQTSMYVK